MAELIEINVIKKNLYKENSPVILSWGKLMKEQVESSTEVTSEVTSEVGDNFFINLSFKSVSDKVISSVLVDIHLFDRANNEIEVIREYQYFNLEVNRGEDFGDDVDVSVYSEKGVNFSVAIRNVVFSDESIWEGSASWLFETVTDETTLLEVLEDEETAQQYARDFLEKVSEKDDVEVKYTPFEYKNLWFCSCGEYNHHGEKCISCGGEFTTQKEMIDNRVQLAMNLSAYRAEQERLKEEARLEAERIAKEKAEAEAEAKRLAEEERVRLEKLAIRRKRNKKIFIAVSIPTAIAIIIYVILLISYIKPNNEYKEATELLNSGSYDEAWDTFNALGSFSDSSDMLTETKYQQANSLLESQSYEEAMEIYLTLGDYSDTTTKIDQTNYEIALQLISNEDYEGAIDLLEDCLDYSDAADKRSLASLNLATEALNEGNLDEAKALIENLNDNDNLTLETQILEIGQELYASDDESYIDYFNCITQEELLSQISEIYYESGIALMESGEYDQAEVIFSSISTYSDSETQLLKLNYLRSEALLEADDYDGALAMLELAVGYEGTEELVNKCNYEKAVALYKSKDYAEAIEIFSSLGDYSDAEDKFNEASYDYGISLINQGEIFEAYEVLYAAKTYLPAYTKLVTYNVFYQQIYNKGLGDNPNYEGLF